LGIAPAFNVSLRCLLKNLKRLGVVSQAEVADGLLALSAAISLATDFPLEYNLALIGPAMSRLAIAPTQRHRRQRQLLWLTFLLTTLADFTACDRPSNTQAAFDHARQTFMHGDLEQSQGEAHRQCERLRNSSPEWAWKFRILEAESLLWRGMYADVLTLLNSPPTRPDTKNSVIEILAIEGVAHARLHQFGEAEQVLGQATQMCQAPSELTCGDVIRARGVLAVQHGQIGSAKQFFEQSLQFARAHNDHFLEVTALLNLGLTSLREEHFDEAIDWTNAAYQSSIVLGTDDIVRTALGNLGWAYYNLGDSEKSLELSLEAERRATQVGDVIDQLYWITNAGYVYAGIGDLARAKQSYLKALDLATTINGKQGIYNALRALALVSVESGELEDARKYSDEAIAIARADKNRLDELYPLLVKGLIAARSNDADGAEQIFIEVVRDRNANPPLQWRAEHALARLYEDGGRSDAADREYRAALATFEAARSSLQRNDSKLPFSSNASRIYDDYVHFLISRGKTSQALQVADYSRARTLTEGLGLLPKGSSFAPDPLNAQQAARGAGGTIFFYWVGEKQSYLWAITPQKISLFPLPPATEIDAAVQRYRKALVGPQDVLETANADGTALYKMLVSPAQPLLTTGVQVFIIPDGSLNSLNFETLLVPGPKLHYWIEDATIADASSIRLLAASNRLPHGSSKTVADKLLLIGDAVAASPEYGELSKAGIEIDNIEKHFAPGEREVLTRAQATPPAYLGSVPENFAYIHFVAHGTASRLSPLDSAVILSKASAEEDSFKLYARDIIHHPLHAELVTISTCYGAGSRAYTGEGLVGLSWAFLRAGAHNVIGALWDVSDTSTPRLMDQLYGELKQGRSPEAALRSAKLSLLHSEHFRKPFYWAPFQLYTGT
jgi:CHAT domain-containing protein/Flp pilus assembly protein TadD